MSSESALVREVEITMWLDQVDFDLRLGSDRVTELSEKGWSRPEPDGTWAVDQESIITLPAARYPGDYQLTCTVMPMIVPERVDCQRLCISFNGHSLGTRELSWSQYTDIVFEIPAAFVSEDQANSLAFFHADAASPSQFGNSGDERKLSVMFSALRVSIKRRHAPRHGSSDKRLFIIMGACLPGVEPNVELVRFLYSEESAILLWLDCLDPADFCRINLSTRAQFPDLHVGLAPRALWGGPSIVRSMLQALSHALVRIPGWAHVTFTSTLDVPLLPRTRLLDQFKLLQQYDLCASRWTGPIDHLIIPDRFVIGDNAANRYIQFPYRADTHLRIDADLADICPQDRIHDRRITRTLADRYCFAITENFCTSTLSFHKLTPERANERRTFFSHFPLIAGRMWISCSKRFAEILVGDEASDLLDAGFRDLFIADECFFQSLGKHYEAKANLAITWRSVYFDNANPAIIDGARYREIIGTALPGDLFARKNAGLQSYASYFGSNV